MYSPKKSLQKAIVPGLLPVAAAGVEQLGKIAGVEVDFSQALTLITLVYGAIRGIRNWVKNRHK